MSNNNNRLFYLLNNSAVWVVIGTILLFSSAVIVTLIAPMYADKTWMEPTSSYQVQMYEVADPNLYISNVGTKGWELQFVYHLKKDYSLHSYSESEGTRIVAPDNLERYITRYGEKELKLTSRLLMLRKPEGSYEQAAERLRKQLFEDWKRENPSWKEQKLQRIDYQVYELFEVDGDEALAVAETDGVIENWVESDFAILDESSKQPYHKEKGVVYINNPEEFRVAYSTFGSEESWEFSSSGERITTLDELKSEKLGFLSRKELIDLGEDIFRIEGCWYCHTDQTRTLVQDTVLNGSDSEPAPPSSSSEYVYNRVSFMGTRRIGPDLSRVGVKRPSRDWHKSHFWSPKTASAGSIMPSFRHFFDDDPRGTSKSPFGVPNYQFEAIFQYLMTKGTRITPPTQAWWLGKDPVQTKAIIEGKKSL